MVGLNISLRFIFKPSYSPHCININVGCNGLDKLLHRNKTSDLGQMKFIGLLFFLTIDFSVFGQTEKLTVDFKIDKEYFVTYTDKINYVPTDNSLKQKRFDVTISLTNNSSDTVKVWLMTCGWVRNFIINNIYISFSFEGCDANYPHVVKIDPLKSFLIKGTLERNIQWDNPPKNSYGQMSRVKETKIGFIYVDKNDCKNFFDYDDIMEDKSRWTIIWSNSLQLAEIKDIQPKFLPPPKK